MIKDQLLKQGQQSSPKPNQDNVYNQNLGRSSGTGQSTERKEGGSRQMNNGKDQSGSREANSNDSGQQIQLNFISNTPI